MPVGAGAADHDANRCPADGTHWMDTQYGGDFGAADGEKGAITVGAGRLADTVQTDLPKGGQAGRFSAEFMQT